MIQKICAKIPRPKQILVLTRTNASMLHWSLRLNFDENIDILGYGIWISVLLSGNEGDDCGSEVCRCTHQSTV